MSEYVSLHNKNIRYKWVSPPVLSEEDKNEIKDHFNLELVKNPKIFNGKGISCTRFEVNSNIISIDICETDFSRNIWSRDLKKFVPGTQIIGTNIIFCDLDEKCLYLDVRSSGVMYGKGSFGAFGGMIDFNELLISADSEEFLNYG